MAPAIPFRSASFATTRPKNDSLLFAVPWWLLFYMVFVSVGCSSAQHAAARVKERRRYRALRTWTTRAAVDNPIAQSSRTRMSKRTSMEGLRVLHDSYSAD